MKIIIEPENGPAQVWSTEPAENRATLYENRAKELETSLAEEKDRAEAWELRCEELEQELRDAQGQLDESVRKEARLGLEANKLRDRIGEQNWLIAQYDDDNRDLKRQLNDIWDRYRAEQSARMKAQNERDEAFDMDSLNGWAMKIHKSAVEHGWWETEDGKCDDGSRNFGETCMMCVTELAEAVNEYRNGRPLAYEGENGKPEGVAVEMVDCIIRLLDWAGHEEVDVDTVLNAKYKFNLTRPHRHGGKKL